MILLDILDMCSFMAVLYLYITIDDSIDMWLIAVSE